MKKILCLLPLFTLASCAVSSGEIGKTSDTKLETLFPKTSHTVSLMATDPTGKKLSKDVAQQIFSSQTQAFFSRAAGAPVKITPEGDSIKVDLQIDQGLNYDRYTTTFPISYGERGGAYTYMVSCPSEIHYQWRDYSLTGRLRVNGDAASQTFLAYCTKFAFEVPRYQSVEGEVNVEYEDKAVLANFRRLLKPAGDRYRSYYANNDRPTNIDIEKAERFEFDSTYKDTVLSVVVYPYRKGSKVKYAFVVPYSLDSNGGSNYDPAMVKSIKKRIQEIAQD